jgi:RHS repeat-associated protein
MYLTNIIIAIKNRPFGMAENGRKFTQGNIKYRYGFNGKEQDIETTGTSTYDYGFRIYSPALGRFLSVDPLTKEYPWNSTYAFAENNVMRSIDLEGAEKYIVTGTMWKGSGGTQLQNLTVTTLDKPGPLGNGTYHHIKTDDYKYTSEGRIGNQYDVIGYTPSAEEQPTAWNKFWAKMLDGGASDNGGATGSRSNQASSGTGNNADNFEVSEGTGVFVLLGGIKGGKLTVLALADEAKRKISIATKVLDNLAKADKAGTNAVKSAEDLANKVLNEASATPSNSSANTKQGTTAAVKTTTQNSTSQTSTTATRGKESKPKPDSIFVWRPDGDSANGTMNMRKEANPKTKKKGG